MPKIKDIFWNLISGVNVGIEVCSTYDEVFEELDWGIILDLFIVRFVIIFDGGRGQEDDTLVTT